MKLFTFFGFLLRPFFEFLRFTIMFFETFHYQVESMSFGLNLDIIMHFKFYAFGFDFCFILPLVEVGLPLESCFDYNIDFQSKIANIFQLTSGWEVAAVLYHDCHI